MVQNTSIEKVLHNLQFDRLFLDRIKEKEKKLGGGGEATWKWSSIPTYMCFQSFVVYA